MQKFTQLREIAKNEHDDSVAIRESELYLSGFNRTTLDPEEFLDYVDACSLVFENLSDFYLNTMTKHTQSTHQVHQKHGYKACDYPFHRKLRLSAYINHQQADARLKCNMIRKFGKRLIIVYGNWSASMMPSHAPIRGRGWRKKFKKFGFPTYLLDEFCTSKCQGGLKSFKWVANPRPYRRWQRRLMLCHGLLQCSNCLVKQLDDECNVVYKPRLYNRDMMAIPNFQHIIKCFIRTGITPRKFQHSTRAVAGTVAAPAAPDVAVSSSSAASVSTFSMMLHSACRSDLTSDAQPLAKRSCNGSA
ncbi:hypothetical protein GGI13_007625 [Coemansia sp. RSA 455]|nr:hypothetical protein GGI13_007625 [Coemansia sp. RSA 455]